MNISKRTGSFLLIYILGTYSIYLFSPYNFSLSNNIDYFKLTFFVISYALALYFGATSVIIKTVSNEKTVLRMTNYYLTAFNFFLIISFILVIAQIIEGITKSGFNLTANIGETYLKAGDLKRISNVSRIKQISTFVSPMYYFAIVYGFFIYSKLHIRAKYVFGLFILSILFYNIFILGIQKKAGDILILFSIMYFLKGLQYKQLDVVKKKIILGVGIFVLFFYISSLSRSIAIGSEEVYKTRQYEIEKDNLLFNTIGPKIGKPLLTLAFYVSHGYHGLGLSMNEPFVWTCFYGNSRGISDYLNRYLGLEYQFENSYPVRMENSTGWPSQRLWPTAFAYFASDLSFIGVTLFMYIIGRFFTITLREAYYFSNPLSILMLGWLTIMIIYLPANNQVLQNHQSAIGFISSTILWLLFHDRFNGYKIVN